MSNVKEFSVEEKLTSLVTLQKVESKLDEYKILKGELPSPFAPPAGCPFNPRCPLVFDRCRSERPPVERKQGRDVACWAVAA